MGNNTFCGGNCGFLKRPEGRSERVFTQVRERGGHIKSSHICLSTTGLQPHSQVCEPVRVRACVHCVHVCVRAHACARNLQSTLGEGLVLTGANHSPSGAGRGGVGAALRKGVEGGPGESPQRALVCPPLPGLDLGHRCVGRGGRAARPSHPCLLRPHRPPPRGLSVL